MDQLIEREPIPPIEDLLKQNTSDRTILITGAGGSIGQELCRQVLIHEPRRLILLDRCQRSLDELARELSAQPDRSTEIRTITGSAGDRSVLEQTFTSCQIDIVYHAAADKHVPLVEASPIEGLINNTLCTRSVAQAAADAQVPAFVFISTDKAVRPAGVMGASKRMAELAIQSIAADRRKAHDTTFSIVRFGNVLGSSGSVVPIFREQICSGAPLTVTHADVTRYFMTAEEAAQLVIQAGAMARGGETFVLDMGEPVKIDDLARRMMTLCREEGAGSDSSEIVYVGLRPGEKLHEELCLDGRTAATIHPRITRTIESTPPRHQIDGWLDGLEAACEANNVDAALCILTQAVESYRAQQNAHSTLTAEEH